MPTWNVAVAVVDLVEANTAADAIAVLGDRLRAADFEIYEGNLPNGADAFESGE